ncbi:MAG TPA: hypothetical protein VM010_07305, partial [Chitinophagaceae bacterium]|nr:hypothetical protein [Chitinophagaceae bacterium]
IMRKLVFTAFLFASTTAVFAQNLDDVQEKISKQKYADSKVSIDKVLSDAKGHKNATAWYYKGVIYNELAKDSTKDNSAYRKDAYEALKKGQELDPKNVMGELEQNWRLFDIYNFYLNNAIKNHNAKDYTAALNNYKSAIEVQQYINKKGFAYNNQTLPALDTAVTLYAGSAAYLAKDTAAGLQFFSQLADAKVGGKEYLEAYQLLVEYYNRKGDKANAEKYAALGKQLYPDNEYWLYYELQDPALKADKAKMMAKYEEVVAKNPSNAALALDYAIELFNYTYGENKPADYKAAQAKLDDAIRKAVEINKSAEANYLMVQNFSNQIYDMQEAQRVTKDAKKKAEYTASINKMYDESAKYAETAAQQFGERSELKVVEKQNYKTVLTSLVNYYKSKKQLDKAKVYEDKLKTLG